MSDRDIAETIRHLAGTHDLEIVYSLDASIDSVNIEARTCICSLIGGKAANTIPDVRLMASVDDGILLVPEVDSTVTIIMSQFADPYISSYSGLAQIVLLGGDLGGLPMVRALLTKINNLENLLNNLIEKYNLHVHPVVSVGNPTGVTSAIEGGVITLTELNEIENTNITQG